MTDLAAYVAANRSALLDALLRHVVIVAASTTIAIAAGLPLGVLAVRRPRLGAPLLGLASVAQTIPSLALLGFLIPIPYVGGIGPRAAIVALVFYGLLPIVQTTAAGLRSIDRSILEAADALGMMPRQRLWRVELPLALPSIVAGIRVATVAGIGTATIAAAIGAGGLGHYIFRGLAMVDSTVILAGAIPIALLAIAADALLATIGRSLRPETPPAARRRLLIPLGTAAAIAVAALSWPGGGDRPVVVGSKAFTEQVILGELVAQTLEAAGLPVERRLNLGGTFICDRALAAGEIDVYVEYTGTALAAIFREPVQHDPQAVLALVREHYAASGRTVLEPLGFDNTFAILVRRDAAEQLGLVTIGDLVRVSDRFQPGFGYEFVEREDGWAGLSQAYGLRFTKPPQTMDLGLTYQALARGEVDVIAGDRTAGLIDALDLVVLEDDRRYFPPYEAAPVVFTPTLMREPRLGDALRALGGAISADEMRRMNDAVDRGKRSPAEVVRQWRLTNDD